MCKAHIKSYEIVISHLTNTYWVQFNVACVLGTRNTPQKTTLKNHCCHIIYVLLELDMIQK